LPIKKDNKKKLLYVSRLAYPEIGISLDLLQKAQALAQMGHEHLYPILSTRMHKNRVLALLPYFPGNFLKSVEKPMPPAKAFSMVLSLARAVEHEIEHWGSAPGVFHTAIYQEITGHLYLVEHGLLRGCFITDPPVPARNTDLESLYFIAPEQISQHVSPTPLSSQFFLAAFLFNMLTGQYVYSSEMPEAIEKEALSFSPPVHLLGPSIAQNFFKTALALDPSRRYGSIAHFIDVLSMIRCAMV
jgi:serine/threonine protein kinase